MIRHGKGGKGKGGRGYVFLPTSAAVDENRSILPWMAPTFLEPYRSAW